VQAERQGLETEIAALEEKGRDFAARLNEAELSIEGKRITLLETERQLAAAQ